MKPINAERIVGKAAEEDDRYLSYDELTELEVALGIVFASTDSRVRYLKDFDDSASEDEVKGALKKRGYIEQRLRKVRAIIQSREKSQ